MLTESGRVVAIEPDGLWVETIRKTTCGSCAAQSGCGHGLLSRYLADSRGLIRVLPGAHSLERCQVDDEVLISIPEEIILRGSLIAYLLPVVSMVAGAVAASHWLSGDQDLLAALGGIAGLAAGFLLVRWHGVRHRHDHRFQPVLVKVLSAPVAAHRPA